MRAREYPLESGGSLLHLWSSTLAQSSSAIVPFYIFWLLLAVKSDLTLASKMKFQGIVGRVEPRHLPRCFRISWPFLFYHCGGRVDPEILFISIKSSSSIRWCRSTAQRRIFHLSSFCRYTLSMFSAPANSMMAKIVSSNFELVSQKTSTRWSILV
jgi:hypothetical protein